MQYDEFQQKAIHALKKGWHVLVSAPTSSGKTCIAEHLLQQDTSGVIYTAPTKALCNQKFVEFYEKGYDVGLLTGDRCINEEAIHTVATTEILLKLLVQNNNRIGEVAHFVFDEAHFLGDRYRGHVWEECILKCLPGTQMLFLSATIPNSTEICSWLNRCTQHHVELVVETKRPVPLEMCIFQRDGTFAATAHRNYKNSPGRRRSDWIQLCYNLKRDDLMPAVIFIFNRWECHLSAQAVASVDWLTKAESSCVLREIKNLKMDDGLRNALLRGVGVHHSGLTPSVRESVEVLTQKGILRVVFATETLAIGLNMPTRTVVFSSLNKPDEESGTQRLLTPAEYKQLIGRAGRRGYDTKGTVIFPWWIPSVDLDRLLDADLPRIKSQLRITTQLVLHHEETILGRAFLTYPHIIERSDEEEKLWGQHKDHIDLYTLSRHAPIYKFTRKAVKNAAYALTANGFAKICKKVPKDAIALANKKQTLLPLQKFILPEKTLWYLENRYRIHALVASKPGPPPENIAEMTERKKCWDEYLVPERKAWAQVEDTLQKNGFFLGSQKLQAARYFYAVDPIKAVEFLTSGGLQSNTSVEILLIFCSFLNCKCEPTIFEECLKKGTTLAAEENFVFEGDLINTVLRVHNVIHEFQLACEVLFTEKSKVLDEATEILKPLFYSLPETLLKHKKRAENELL